MSQGSKLSQKEDGSYNKRDEKWTVKDGVHFIDFTNPGFYKIWNLKKV